MKNLTIGIILCLLTNMLNAQVSYYKGEWKQVNNKTLFGCILKLEVKDIIHVSGEIVWTYIAIDSSNAQLVEFYKGKKGKTGIEFVEGTTDPSTSDYYFEGMRKNDPDSIIGLDKYTLKISSDKHVIFGKSDSNGQNNGLLYAQKLTKVQVEKEFKAVKNKMK